MSDDVSWLVDEIEELLTVSWVGLYEFVEALRQLYPEADAKDLRQTCARALDRLLNDSSLELGWYVWASGSGREGSASRDDVRPETFDEIGPDPYLGIERM